MTITQFFMLLISVFLGTFFVVLCIIDKVSAATFDKDVKMTSSVQLYRCPNKQCTNSPGLFNGSFRSSGYFWQTTSSITYSGSSDGGVGLAFSTDTVFMENNYYSITVYLSAQNGSTHYRMTNVRDSLVGTGYGWNPTYQYRKSYIMLPVEVSTQLIYIDDADTIVPFDNVWAVSYLFQATISGNYVFLQVANGENGIPNSSTSNLTFLGYQVDFAGSPSDNTQQIVSTATNNINNNINSASSSIMSTIEEQEKQTQNAVNDVNNSINNSSTDSPSGTFDSLNSLVAENNVISSLLLMPVTLYRSILNNVNSTCSTFSLGSLFGKNLTMPCINLASYFGNLWGIIDVIISGFLIFNISKKFIKVFNNFTSLKEGDILD